MSELLSVYLVRSMGDGDADEVRHLEALRGALGELGVALSEDPGEGPVALGDTTVTLVVVGEHTWRSARVDAVIAASAPRNALMGLLLPGYDYPPMSARGAVGDDMLHATDPRDDRFWAHNIPLRLFEAYDADAATVRPWSTRAKRLGEWLAEATVTAWESPRPALTEDLGGDGLGWTLATVRALQPEVKIQGGPLND